MYEFHGWITLAETATDVDIGTFDDNYNLIRTHISRLGWPSGVAEFLEINGRVVLVLNGYPNRRRSEAKELTELVSLVATKFKGAYGLIYELDELTETTGGRGVFSVTVVKRGECLLALDPFLSPTIPSIENP